MFEPSQIQIVEPANLYSLVYTYYPELKFWASFAAIIIGGYKALQWLKSIKTNDLFHIHESVKGIEAGMITQTLALEKGLKEQTQAYANEIKELRADLRGFTNAFIVPPRRKNIRK